MIKRGAWKTRFGFYLVAVGSACGLGNLWRFPYVVGENGGGAFVLLYVLLALLVGLPLLIGELVLGKSSRKSILIATSELSKKVPGPWSWFGTFALVLSFLVFSYYTVISGWVLHYFVQFMMSLFQLKTLESQTALNFLMDRGSLQVGLASVHILITILVVTKGVQEGLERWMRYAIPLFGLLLFILMFQALSLPTATSAIRFLFYPDFSKLTLSSLISALGHVFFTLSVGFGTMVTFGSYLKEEDHIPSAAIRVAMVDSLISVFAGLLVFAIVLGSSYVKMTDPAILFEAVPRFLLQMPGGILFGVAFFLCLYMAALSASIGLFEMIVSNLTDRLKWNRLKASWIAGGLSLAFAIIPALSSSVLKDFQFLGKGLLEYLDWLMINWLLPLVALGLSVAISKAISQKELQKHFIDKNKFYSHALFANWLFTLKWIVPLIIVLAMILQMVDLTS